MTISEIIEVFERWKGTADREEIDFARGVGMGLGNVIDLLKWLNDRKTIELDKEEK